MKTFDNKEPYEREIVRSVTALMSLCYKYKIPCFFTAAVSNSEDGKAEYRTDSVSPHKAGCDLNIDHIADHLKVTNGFVTVIPGKPVELDMNE